MPFAWAGLASSVVGAGTAIYGASQSSSNAAQSAALADPFASQRPQYQGQLSALMADPSSISKTPGYQFQFDQGMQALERQQAAGGAANSGQAETAAIQFGQGLAQTSFGNWESMLADLSGANIGNPGQAGQLSGQYQNQANQGIQSAIGSLTSAFGKAINAPSSLPAYDQTPTLPASAFGP